MTELLLEKDDNFLLQQLVSAVKPRLILVCKGTEILLGEALLAGSDIQVVKKNEYGEESARQRLLTLNLEGVPAALVGEAERALWISSLIDLTNKPQMVRAAGALIGHMAASAGEQHGMSAVKLSEVAATGLVRVDTDAFQSLQIFGTEYHPSAAGVGGAKEAFSLFARFNRAKSVCGRRLLKTWFQQPTNDIQVLNDRLNHVESFSDPSSHHAGAIKQTHAMLSSVKDVRRICTKIASLQSTCGDWIALRHTLAAVLDLRDLTRPMATETNLRLLVELQSYPEMNHLGKLCSLMDAVLDIDQSKSSKRLTVRAGVDPTLDELKNNYQGLGDLLTQVASAQVEALPLHVEIDSLSTVYFPMIGYAVVVPRRRHTPVSEQISAVAGYLEYMFDTEAYVYFKSAMTKELDEKLGDLHSRIVDRENLCIRELETHLLEKRETMRTVVDLLAQLDCVLSLAVSATELRMVRPKLTDAPRVLLIRAGRHPLQELTVQTFVPNDADLCGEEKHAQIITGPNASGKSIFIKQTALIAFLAHIGSFVPAEEAQVGMLDGIFARIQTRESTGVGKSAFLLDLTQVATMLRHASQRSLVSFGRIWQRNRSAGRRGVAGGHARTSGPRQWRHGAGHHPFC